MTMMCTTMAKIVTFLAIFITKISLVNTSGGGLRCKPRPVLIPTYEWSSATPHYVKVLRCLGQDDGYSTIKRCVPLESGKRLVGVWGGQPVYTHTQCRMRTACMGNGVLNVDGVADCYPGERWDPYACRCVRDCPHCSNIACSVKEEDKGTGT